MNPEICGIIRQLDVNKIIGYINEEIQLVLNAHNLHISTKKSRIQDAFDNDSQTTADVTKTLSPLIITPLFKDSLIMLSNRFKNVTGPGFDMKFDEIPIEVKITQSNKTWTGNKHSSKTPVHVLIKIELNNSGFVDKLFFGVIDLDDCSGLTKWVHTTSKKKNSENSENSGFSSLSIHNSDINKMNSIIGRLEPDRKWAKIIMNRYDVI
jgi:hypothetical protein